VVGAAGASGIVGIAGGPGTGGAVGSAGSTGSGGSGGSGGMTGACIPGDTRLLLADQRILPLTTNEVLNTVRYLIGDAEATALATAHIVDDGDQVPSLRHFPPLATDLIDDTTFPALDRVATHVGQYVLDNFATVLPCTQLDDRCATAYLTKLAVKAYRRQLTADETMRWSALYTRLRSAQTINGYEVTFSIQEATSLAVEALLRSPQVLWRWEIGTPGGASASPAGVPLTDAELATQLAFFLTDQPPDDALLNISNVGMLRANLTTYVSALLSSQAAQDWLRTIMETYFRVNTLPRVVLDPTQFPTFNAALAADMGTETRMFLDHALWKENLSAILLSRSAFLNTRLASDIYGVDPPPAGASLTTFAPTTLPATERSGLLTNAGFLTAAAPPDQHHALFPRAQLVASVFLCQQTVPAPPVGMSYPSFGQQTAQEQVAARQAAPCTSCHAQVDPYGLALDNYDSIGRYRTVDDLGQPVDAHTQLPDSAGGGTVASGVELAQALAASPAFTACMARTLLQYAMTDASTAVEIPAPQRQQAGCATADVVQRYQGAAGSTFTDLVRATAAAPSFGIRRAAP
jgi:hypothetical protein